MAQDSEVCILVWLKRNLSVLLAFMFSAGGLKRLTRAKAIAQESTSCYMTTRLPVETDGTAEICLGMIHRWTCIFI